MLFDTTPLMQRTVRRWPSPLHVRLCWRAGLKPDSLSSQNWREQKSGWLHPDHMSAHALIVLHIAIDSGAVDAMRTHMLNSQPR